MIYLTFNECCEQRAGVTIVDGGPTPADLVAGLESGQYVWNNAEGEITHGERGEVVAHINSTGATAEDTTRANFRLIK